MTIKLKPEVKQRWLEALRGGSYNQGDTRLRQPGPHGDRFCCLGVLTDLAVKDGVGRWDERGRWTRESGDYPEALVLPSEVLRWAFVNANTWEGHLSPSIMVGKEECSLAELNDRGTLGDDPWAFDKIADVIEEQL